MNNLKRKEDNFWGEIPWQIKAIWTGTIALGVVVVGVVIWAIFKLINHFT